MNRTFGRLARAALDPGVTTDSQLLAEFIARRDDAAFSALVRRHGSMVLAVCRRVLRHQQDAEDAFQATFLVLARKADDVWPRETVGAWLHGVAFRVAMKARGVRARQARREHPLQDVPHLPPEPSPDLAEVLDRAIRKLPEAYRAAVVACDLEGRTRKDAAEQLGWKEGTLSGRLARARQLLAARLRKMGLAVPVLAIDAVPTALAESVVRAAVNTSAGVSAPVAALTEGVVRSMFLVKMKTLAAVVLLAGVTGLGVRSAAGQGPGSGTGERPRASGPSSVPAAAPSDLERLQGEWIYGKRFLDADAKPPREVIDAVLAAAKKDGSLYTVAGAKIDIPLIVPGGDGFLAAPRWYAIKLDPTQSPKHIDLTNEQGRVTQGIYKFEDGHFKFYLDPHGGRPKAFDEVRNNKDPVIQTMWQPRPPQPNKAAPPPAPAPAADAQKDRIEWMRRMVKQGYMSQAQLDRELRTTDPDAAALQGRWRIDRMWMNTTDASRTHLGPNKQLHVVEFTGTNLLLPSLGGAEGQKIDVSAFVVDSSKSPKQIDLFIDGTPHLDGVYELTRTPGAVKLRIALSIVGVRPKKIEPGGRDGVFTFELSRPDPIDAPSPEFLRMMEQVSQMTAQKNVDDAAVRVRSATIAAEVASRKSSDATGELKQAEADLAAARAKLDEAKRAADKVRAAANVPPSFTLHVRTPLAAETAQGVTLAANMTVLDALGTHANLGQLRAQGGLSAWVVRDEKVLTVDIDAITKDGKTATNYQLKNWDKVFVQVNVGK